MKTNTTAVLPKVPLSTGDLILVAYGSAIRFGIFSHYSPKAALYFYDLYTNKRLIQINRKPACWQVKSAGEDRILKVELQQLPASLQDIYYEVETFIKSNNSI